MRRTKNLASFVGAFLIGFLAITTFNKVNIGTNLPTNVDSNYYKDAEGSIWRNKQIFEDYATDSYFLAPDGTYWNSEYQYNEANR